MIPIDVTYNYLILSGDDGDISESILLISVNELCHFLYQCGSRGGMTVFQTDISFKFYYTILNINEPEWEGFLKTHSLRNKKTMMVLYRLPEYQAAHV